MGRLDSLPRQTFVLSPAAGDVRINPWWPESLTRILHLTRIRVLLCDSPFRPTVLTPQGFSPVLIHGAFPAAPWRLRSRSGHLCIEALRCSQLPNFAERYNRRSRPLTGISGFSWNGCQRISSAFSKINDAFFKRRFATKHHGQIKSEVTSTARPSASYAILFATFSIMSEAPISTEQSSD